VKQAKIPEPPQTSPTPPQPEAVAETSPATGGADARSGVTAGATNGDSQGVIGGVAGGHVGGIIGGHGTEPLPVNQVANPPLLLARVTPEYPRPARVQGVEGLVLLEAILNLEGHIEEDIKALQSIRARSSRDPGATALAFPTGKRPRRSTGASYSRGTNPLCVEVRCMKRHEQEGTSQCSFR